MARRPSRGASCRGCPSAYPEFSLCSCAGSPPRGHCSKRCCLGWSQAGTGEDPGSLPPCVMVGTGASGYAEVAPAWGLCFSAAGTDVTLVPQGGSSARPEPRRSSGVARPGAQGASLLRISNFWVAGLYSLPQPPPWKTEEGLPSPHALIKTAAPLEFRAQKPGSHPREGAPEEEADCCRCGSSSPGPRCQG